jgi:DNA replication and repair protein RecF
VLIKNGNYLSKIRQEFIDFSNQKQLSIFGKFQIEYNSSEISASRLKQYEVEEVAAAATLVGPHRDDLIFFEKKRDLSKFGSRGEQRLLVLWLKLSEIDYIEKISGERPLLLLDDIFSELDHGHREEVVNLVNKQQTLLTTTDKHFLPETLLNTAEMIELG